MDALTRLLQKTRPYVAFAFDMGEGELITLYARRMGQVDIERSAHVWEQAYRKAKADFQDTDKEKTALYDALNRASDKRLASIVAKSERMDFVSETASLLEKDTTDKEVQQEADKKVEAREAQLKKLPHEELVTLAFNRRYHSFAMDAGALEQMRHMVRSIIFEATNKPDEYKPAFKSEDEVAQLPQTTVVRMMDAASQALDPETPNKPEAEETSPLT